MIVDIAAGEVEDKASEKKRIEFPRGQAGGRKGGLARSQALTSNIKQKIALNAARARWDKS